MMREIISMKDAKARGLSTYFTGKPCKRGHVSDRSVQSWDCVECSKARARERYASNPSSAVAYGSTRRARKIRATPAWDEDFTTFVTLEAHALKVMREQSTGFRWQVDHMVPLKARTACGLHTWANPQVIPAWMNQWKRNKLTLTRPGDWISRLDDAA